MRCSPLARERLTKEALRHLLSLQGSSSPSNIQKTLADYWKVRLADLVFKRRSPSVTRPRQVAWRSPRSSAATVCRRLTMPLAGAITPSGRRLACGPKSFGAKATVVPRGTWATMLAARRCSRPWEHKAHKPSPLSHRRCIKHRELESGALPRLAGATRYRLSL